MSSKIWLRTALFESWSGRTGNACSIWMNQKKNKPIPGNWNQSVFRGCHLWFGDSWCFKIRMEFNHNELAAFLGVIPSLVFETKLDYLLLIYFRFQKYKMRLKWDHGPRRPSRVFHLFGAGQERFWFQPFKKEKFEFLLPALHVLYFEILICFLSSWTSPTKFSLVSTHFAQNVWR